MKTSGKRYRAFISYSHRDGRWARRVQRFLESYRPPRGLRQDSGDGAKPRSGPVFRDRDELASSADLNEAAERALAASDFLVVVCSPRAAVSRWVNEEVLAFKRLGRADSILCLVVDGEPNATDLPGREGEECFCPALRHRLDADGSLSAERIEPVAADARRGADGWKLARLKLAAGMLGVGLDDLRQRELQRRNRRLAFTSAAALAGMALMVFLTVAAYTARNDAERRREQADDLIGFMLGDLRERLDEVGRLDVLDSVAEKAMDYFAALPPKDLDDRALTQRAEALMQLGQVQFARGELVAARGPFSEALRALQELGARDPADRKRLFELGQAHFWVGYVDWEEGDLVRAEEGMRAYHEVSRTLYAEDPENDDYLLELGYSHNNLAVLADRRGDTRAALEHSERMVEFSRDLFQRHPEDAAFGRALAEAYSWSGSLLHRAFRLDAARERFLEYLGVASGALAGAPDDSQWLDHLMLSNRLAGDVALDLGRLEDARGYYSAGIEAARQLLDIEPENDHWQVEYAVLRVKMAHVLDIVGDAEEFAALRSTLERDVAARYAARPDDPDWRILHARVRLLAARDRRAVATPPSRAELSGKADELQSLLRRNPGDGALRLALVECLWLLDRPADALAVIENTPGDLRRPDLHHGLVEALLRAGDTASARSEFALLDAAGYRHPELMQALKDAGIGL